MSLCTES